MKKVKRKKIVKWLDPEPKFCYPTRCGHEAVEHTGHAVLDLILVRKFIDAPRNTPADYVKHNVTCLWADWARREISRRM